MKKYVHSFFAPFRDFMRTIPERTYPFVERDAQGKKVYLDRAFKRRNEMCLQELGSMPNIHCHRIFFWREFLHLFGGVMFWFIALVIHYYFGTPTSYILPAILIIFLAFQEFFIDRIRYNQKWIRGVIDWVVWIIPLVLFFLINII